MPAILNRQRLDDVNETVKALFIDSLDENGEGPLFGRVTMRVESNQRSETHNWLRDYVQLREWVGPRKYATMDTQGMTIHNKEYEASLAIKRLDIITDNLGMLSQRVAMLPEAYYRGRRKLLAQLITEGTTTTGLGGAGYDGVAFFSNAHPNGELANQSNVASGGSALNAANFDAAVAQMETLVNHKGEPLDIMPDTLVIGPANRSAARSLFQVSTLPNGGDNEHYQMIPTIIVEPRISGNAWYLFDTSKTLKPFIDQMLMPLELQSMTGLDTPNVFEYNEFHWGLYAAFGMGYGFWQTAYRNAGQ